MADPTPPGTAPLGEAVVLLAERWGVTDKQVREAIHHAAMTDPGCPIEPIEVHGRTRLLVRATNAERSF